MMTDKILTICIGTYNRSERVKALIESLLSDKNLLIDVVVVDNCSTDGTYEILHKINDDRLHLYKNEANFGGAYNILKSLDYAPGKYALYCNDRDYILTENLNNLILFLKSADYSMIYTSENDSDFRVVKRGYNAICDSINSHPTGIIFNMDLVRQNKINLISYTKYNKYIYSWSFLERDLKLLKDVCYYDKKIWRQANDEFKNTNKSSFIKEQDAAHLWFTPDSRKLQLIGIINHLREIRNECKLTDKDFYRSCYHVFCILLNRSCLIYKRIRENPSECAHYGIEPKTISLSELKKVYSGMLSYFDRIMLAYDRKYKYCFYFFLVKETFRIFIGLAKMRLKRLFRYGGNSHKKNQKN